MYPYDRSRGQKIGTDVLGIGIDRAFIAHFNIAAAAATAASTAAVHAAINCSTDAVEVTTAFTAPNVPRNITATAGGTAGNIKAVQVKITGTDYNDNVITETLPAFTVDTAGTVVGAKAFKTVTKVEIPAMDGACTVAIGYGVIFGLPYKLAHNAKLAAFLDNASDNATLAVSATALESNTMTMAGSPNGAKAIDLYLIV